MTVNGERAPAVVAADGTVLRWSFDVVQDPPKHKKLSVTAELAGTAAEVSTRTVAAGPSPTP